MEDSCYVCLEECEHRSPCTCSHAVHVNCLEEVKKNVSGKSCTICHSNFNATIPKQKVCSKLCAGVQGVVLLILVYLISGIGGQLLLAILGSPGILFEPVSFYHKIFSINFLGSCWIMLFPIVCISIMCRYIIPSPR